jgi:transposase
MKDQTGLWQLPQITEWLPQETLYSLASRHHHVSGNVLPAETCLQLFGHWRQGSSHDMPSRIDEFVQRTEGILGDADHVIRERTLLPFYFPYRTELDSANAISTVRHAGNGGLKGQLGILASRMGASHPLKACPECMLHDREFLPVSYWHIEHQWPGAWVCLKHQKLLQYAQFKVNGEGRFHWSLPRDVLYAPGMAHKEFEASHDLVVRLTECAYGLGALPKSFHFSPTTLASTYQNRFRELGLFGTTNRLNSAEFLRLLEAVCCPLSHVHGLKILDGTGVPLLIQFSRLIGEHRGVAHPLKHFVIVLALFESWEKFLAAYSAAPALLEVCESSKDTDTPKDIARPLIKAHKKSLIEAVKNGLSITAAAQSFNIAVATAMAWAAEAGIHSPKRAKLFLPNRRKIAIQILSKGGSKENAATAVSVSIQTITLLLRTEPGLRAKWNQAKFDRAQKAARSSWKRMAMKLHPISGHLLRRLRPAEFAWLYRNDRNWLEEFNATLARSVKTNNSNIRWDARDVKYSQAVDAAALALHLAWPTSSIRLADLCNSVPELKARLSNLNQLPLTHAAIKRAMRRRTKI